MMEQKTEDNGQLREELQYHNKHKSSIHLFRAMKAAMESIREGLHIRSLRKYLF